MESFVTQICDDPLEAAQSIKQGGVVIFPTETVYGIGASAYNHASCMKIYKIKERPQDNPLILHTDSIENLCKLLKIEESVLAKIEDILEKHPLTVIGYKRDEKLFSSSLSTVGVRIPSFSITKAFLKEAQVPVAAPSANRSGYPSITYFEEALRIFFGSVDAILKGPPCEVGLESTVIDISGPVPIYLRPGAVSFDFLKERMPTLIRPKSEMTLMLSPGMRYRHYKPDCEVIVVEDLKDVIPKNAGQIGFYFYNQTELDIKVENNEEYAKKLFWFFIEGDHKKLERLYCQVPKKDNPLYEALLNRMERARGG